MMAESRLEKFTIKKLMRDYLLDQAAFRPLLESLVVVIPEGAVSIASRAFADW